MINKFDIKQINEAVFSSVETCRCGARMGAYLVKEEDGYYYRCNDCDLPIKESFHPNEIRRPRYIDEYED